MGDGISQEVLDTVLASTDGNPLFLEERLSSLLETSALVREHGAWRLGRAAGAQVPQALERNGQVPGGPAQLGGPRRRSGPRPCSAPSSPCPCWPRCAPPRAAGRRSGRAARPAFPARGGRARRTRLPLPARPDPGGDLQRAAARRAPPAAWPRRVGARGRSGRPNGRGGGRPRPALRRRRGTRPRPRYYEIAGYHATASFANDEAISSYRAALDIAGEGEASVDLQAKLANVLWRTQRRGQAREAFQAALRAVPAGDTLRRAHLLIRLGRLEVSDSHYEAAWAAYDAAEDLLAGTRRRWTRPPSRSGWS